MERVQPPRERQPRRVTALKIAILESERPIYEIAEAIGVDASAVSRWANGQSQPRVELALSIARELNTTVDALWPELVGEAAA